MSYLLLLKMIMVHNVFYIFYQDLDLVLLFVSEFGRFKRIKSPIWGFRVEDIHAISVDAVPLPYERVPHLIKIDLLNLNRKHMLQILFGRLAAFYIWRSHNPSSLNKNLFDRDRCTGRDFALGQETKVYHNFWLARLIGVQLLYHTIFHHV